MMNLKKDRRYRIHQDASIETNKMMKKDRQHCTLHFQVVDKESHRIVVKETDCESVVSDLSRERFSNLNLEEK